MKKRTTTKKRARITLRGVNLENAALRKLAVWENDWPYGEDKLTWKLLAEALGVSRQALEKKAAVVEAFHQASEIIERERAKRNEPNRALRRTLEERISELEEIIAMKDKQLSAWGEKWVTVEYNCKKYGYDPDLILEPLIKPNRTLV